MAFNVIMQFMLQTAGIVLLVMVMQPILEVVAFSDSLWANVSTDKLVMRDNLYQFSLIIGVVAMGGNIIWLYRAVQRKTVDTQDI